MFTSHRIVTCSVLALALTGCQAGRSVKESIVQWRPFGNGTATPASSTEELVSEEASLNESEELKIAEADVAPSVTIETVSAQVEQQASPDGAETTDALAFDPASEQSNPFADYLKAMENGEQNNTESALPEGPIVENDAPQAELVIAQTEENGASVEQNAAGNLTSQMKQLLSEVQQTEQAGGVDSKDQAVVTQSEEAVGVKSADLTQRKDAALIAFDLASFADVSVKKGADVATGALAESTLAEQSGTQPTLSFEEWARDNASTAREIVAEVQQAAGSSRVEFPWADSGNGNQAATNGAADIREPSSGSRESTQPLPLKPLVSQEILAVLEDALGSDNWKKADLNAKPSGTKWTPELQQISSQLSDKRHQVRLRGIRLAYEHGAQHTPLADEVEKLLHDPELIVRTHTAVTLYHWNRSSEQAVKTLEFVVTSGDEQAAQLAAMFLGDMARESERVVPVLEAALLSTRGMTSMHVAEALLRHDPENVQAVARLSELMRHENAEIRWLTAHALGSVQGKLRPYAVEALRGGLRDIDSQVRATSALSLGGLGEASKVAVAELTFISVHAEPRVRDAAAIALECIQ
ncbi:MAG: HEAT repeat domain-containing protein [Planctomycetaceae bacterium]|nr:HEAT repeat domain-containing protein [Planctomycetaceae bacterium]